MSFPAQTAIAIAVYEWHWIKYTPFSFRLLFMSFRNRNLWRSRNCFHYGFSFSSMTFFESVSQGFPIFGQKTKRNNFHLDVSLNVTKGFHLVLPLLPKHFGEEENPSKRAKGSLRDISNHICVRTTPPEKGIKKLCTAFRYFFGKKEFNKDGRIPFASPLFWKEFSTITFYCDHYF